MLEGATSPAKGLDAVVVLPRVRGPAKHLPSSSIFTTLHLVLVVVPFVLVTSLRELLWNYLLFRPFSPLVHDIGRPALGAFLVSFIRRFLHRASLEEIRLVFDRTTANDAQRPDEWEYIQYVRVNDVGGRWLAPPGSVRGEEEIVLLWTHGGGFTIDMGASFVTWGINLVKAMNAKGIRFSIFWLDHELSPEYIFPTQLIEITAAYQHLFHDLAIPEERITIGGDSSGGTLTLSLLLHLARPTPLVQLPRSLGALPKRPGSVFVVSPWVQLIPGAHSYKKHAQFDMEPPNLGEHATAHYVGADPNLRVRESWNPLRLFLPDDKPLEGLVGNSIRPLEEGEHAEGLALLRSPYVNPSMATDLSWWSEACPGEGSTFVAWGGRELTSDNITEFVQRITAAGVAPTLLFEEYSAHDWVPFFYAGDLGDQDAQSPGLGVGAMCRLFREEVQGAGRRDGADAVMFLQAWCVGGGNGTVLGFIRAWFLEKPLDVHRS